MPPATRAGPGFFELFAAGDVEHLGDGHADVAIAIAANDDGGLRFGIAAGVDELGSSVVERQQLAFEAQDRTGAGALDAGAGNALDAHHGFQRQRGAAVAGFDEEEVLAAGAIFVAEAVVGFRRRG